MDERSIARGNDRLNFMVKLNELARENVAIQESGVRAVAKATIDAQSSLGLIRPGQAGLSNIGFQQADITAQIAAQKAHQADLNKLLSEGTWNTEKTEQYNLDILKTTNDIYALQKQWETLEASKLQYLSEYAPAYDGLLAGLKKYVTSAGTLYDNLSSFAENSAKGMESSFSNFFQSMTDKTKSWSQKLQGFFKDMANAFIKALSDMAAKALVTNLFGGSTGGGGLGNILNALGIGGGGGGGTTQFSGWTGGLENTQRLRL